MYALLTDSGGGQGSPGTVQSTEYYQLTGIVPPPTVRIESFFDVFAPSGLTAVAIPGPVSYADSFFDIFFDVQFSDGGIMTHRLHGWIPPGQDLAFAGVSGVMAQTRPDRCVVSYDASLSYHGRPDALLPVMTVELTGSYIPEPATLGLLAAGGMLLRRRLGPTHQPDDHAGLPAC